jgi:uncharacterized protein
MTSRIIDGHIHMYPPSVYADPEAWGRQQREPWWTYCVAPPHRETIQGWADVSELLRDMDRAGIERSVMLGWYWENQDTCDLQNGWFAEWILAHPDRLLGFASVQPNAGQRAIEQLHRALDSGLCGIGEMLPQAQHFTFKDECWARVVEVATERKLPINIHVSSPLPTVVAVTTPTPLESYVALAGDFPDAKFILAHWGGGLPFYEFNPAVARKLKNVTYDTAASPLSYSSRIFRPMVDLVGAERIIYGSDYPLLLYPRHSRQPGFERFLGEIKQSGLKPDEADKILGGNLLRLIGR